MWDPAGLGVRALSGSGWPSGEVQVSTPRFPERDLRNSFNAFNRGGTSTSFGPCDAWQVGPFRWP